MSAVSRSSSSPSSGSVMQGATELERNSSVSCIQIVLSVCCLRLQTQDSGLGFFANAQNILINGGTFVSNLEAA